MDELDSYLCSVIMTSKYRSILDVGCAYGHRSFFFGLLGLDVTGIDIATKYIEKAKERYKHLRFLVKDIRNFKTKKKYDVVFTHGCLIHITHEDIEKTIKKLMSLGKEGLFVESEGKEEKQRLKYDNSIYWNNRARFPDEKYDLPMQYYYCHDYEKLFKKLGYGFQMIKEFDKKSKTRMWRVYE